MHKSPVPGTGWPLFAVLVENGRAHDRITFALSDVAPDTDLGPVVLGVDELVGEDGRPLVLRVSFAPGSVEVAATSEGESAPEVDGEALVEYLHNAVVVTTRLRCSRRVPGRGPSGFCTIAGVSYQHEVPVLMLPEIAP